MTARRLLALSVSVLTAVAGLVTSPAPASAAITPTMTQVWTKTLPGAVVESSPLAADLAGDGQLKIVFGAHDGNVYALHGHDGTNVGGWPRQTGSAIDSSPSAANVAGDGKPEIFIGSGTAAASQGSEWSYNADGSTRWDYEPRDNDFPDLSMFSTPAIGDVNNDGVADVSGFSLGLLGWSFNQTGQINGGWPFYQDDTVFSSPALFDVDADGQTDYVVGGDSTAGGPVDHRGGFIRAIRGDGTLLWAYPIDEMVRSSPSVGDIDGDGQPEIVVGAGDYWDRQPGGANDSEKLFVLNRNGTLKWVRNLGAYTMASPTLADVDGNGVLDIAIGTWDGANAGKVFAYDGNGNTLPGFNGAASGGGVVLGQITTADLNADGGQDLLVPTGGGIFVHSGKGGGQLFALEAGASDFKNSPLVTDLDADGLLDIVIAGKKPGGAGTVSRYEMTNAASTLGAKSWPQFRKDNRRTGSWIDTPLVKDYCGNNSEGYWMAASDGGVFAYCKAAFKGSMGGTKLNSPVVGMAGAPDGGGYWMVAADGGVFSFGSSRSFGSMGGKPLNAPVVSMAPTASGNGYWLVASDGGIFSFGDARFFGSMGGHPLNQPIVGIVATPDGNGYWMVASDGGIFAFGNAAFHGSMGGAHLNQPIVGMAPNTASTGYRMVASDGGIFSFHAEFRGSMGGAKLNQPIVGMAPTASGDGYRMVARDGGIFAFNASFLGSTGNLKLNQPIVGIAVAK